MKWLVFSKDRPYQLDAFIRTAAENAGILPSDVSVLYRYSENFTSDLLKLREEHPDVKFIEQNDFRNDVLQWLDRQESRVVSFATDDALFTRAVPTKMIEEILIGNPNIATYSLRMGLHLDHCYPTNSSQKLPDGMIQQGVFVWSTNGADGDWGYPLSVDGHVFNRELVKEMFSAFDFKNPNSLESNWQVIRQHISPIACCLPKSCYFNVPLNRVQDDYKNRCGNIDSGELQIMYRNGERHESKRFKNFINSSAHQESDIT